MSETCWLCVGWGNVDRHTRAETAWSDATGGEKGERTPLYELHPAIGTFTGELIECPVCRGKGTRP